MLNADELGEKGQAHFKEICADAKLICNQSDRDRTGWDFIIEYPFEAVNSATPLESRKTPLSCHVQVKTLLDKNDKFQTRLSSAERLAKELKPAFIYVFKVNESLQFTHAYLIHILDEPLGKILKRLRKEDSIRNLAPNKKVLSWSASIDGKMIPPTGLALRDALSAAVGTDLRAYAAKKEKQLETLGFEERPYTAEMALKLNGADLVDVFLGLRKNVPVIHLRADHTRFGIRIPMPELTEKDAIVTIQPSPADTCTITVGSDPISKPAVFKGQVFFPAIPNLPPELGKILFKTDLFSMIFTRNGWTFNSETNLPPQTPTIWASYWRLAFVMATGVGTIQIASNTRPLNPSVNVTSKADELDPEQCRFLIMLCEQLSSLFRFVGVADEPKLSMKVIAGNAQQIAAAYGLISPESKEVTLTFSLLSETGEIPEETVAFDVLCVDYLELGDVALGYYALAHMVGNHLDDKTEWESEGVVLKGLKQLHSLPKDYERMIEVAQKETGCENVFRWDLNRPTPAVGAAASKVDIRVVE